VKDPPLASQVNGLARVSIEASLHGKAVQRLLPGLNAQRFMGRCDLAFDPARLTAVR
jgi:hypothetical protein